LLMTFFDLIGVGLEAAFDLNLLAALFPLGNAAYLKAFTPEQLDALACLSWPPRSRIGSSPSSRFQSLSGRPPSAFGFS